MARGTEREAGAKRDLAEHAQHEPVLPGVRPDVGRGAVYVAAAGDHELSPTRKRRSGLVAILVGAGVLAVIGAVVLAVFLTRERVPGPSSTLIPRQSSAGQSAVALRGPGPYRVTATVPVGKYPEGVTVEILD